MSDPRLYPSGAVLIDSRDVETVPTSSDLIETFSDTERKAITIANIFATIPEIGAVTPGKATFSGLFGSLTEVTSAGAVDADASFVNIVNATPATVIAITHPGPKAGKFLIVAQTDSGTVSNTFTLATGTFDGTHNSLTINAKDECVVAYGISASRFVIIENIGSVTLATV